MINILEDIFLIVFYDIKNINNLSQKIKYLKKKNSNIIFILNSKIETYIAQIDEVINFNNFLDIKTYILNTYHFDYFFYIKNLDFFNLTNVLSLDFQSNILFNNDNYFLSNLLLKKISNLNNNIKIIKLNKCNISSLEYNFDTNFVLNKKNKLPFLSIIMTTYNSENTIEIAIKSILNQTYANFEFIIVDDNSNDKTLSIILKYLKIDERIIVIKNDTNYGCYISKNIALKNISEKSEYIAFQDSDDISYSSRIFKQLNFMIENKLLMSTVLYYEKNIYKLPMISCMINKIVFENIGFFNCNRYGSDEEYYIRYFTLFEKKTAYNNDLQFNTKKCYFSNNCKYYRNLNEVLYVVRRSINSLTNKYKNRELLSNAYQKKFNLLKNKDFILIKNSCFISFNNNFKFKLINDNYTIHDNIIFPTEIRQAHVSTSLKHLKDRFLNKYKFKDFSTFTQPCIFFGMYNQKDINILNRLKNNKYIIWGGTDIDLSFQERVINLKKINNIKYIKHYSISNNITERLKKINLLNVEQIKFSLLDNNNFYKQNILGDSIFIYNGIEKDNHLIYGSNVYGKIIKELKEFNFITSNTLNIPNNEMINIYKKCFIGLRLTKNDGNANSVQEMLKTNLPVIHNGDYNTIKWKNEKDIIANIKKNIPKYLIIFKKDLNLLDGSFTWLINFIKLLQLKNKLSQIYVNCFKINKNIQINNVIFQEHLSSYEDYNYIFFRIDKEVIKFNSYNNITLIIHYFDKSLIDYYNNFSTIFVNSILIKDEFIFNNLQNKNIKILPPLIEDIKEDIKKNNKITFCYCGTLKKSYKSLEVLEMFKEFSKFYDFTFNLIYGKILEQDDSYDNKLKKFIKIISKNKNFNIYSNLTDKEYKNILNVSHYGIVSHSKETDFKQQSTKLIEYLSHQCIPISYLTFLNSNYININLNFLNLDELSKHIRLILSNIIKFNEISINYEKLKYHIISNNLNIFDDNIKCYVTTKNVNLCEKILITNNYKNIFTNNRVIYFNGNFGYNSEILREIINNNSQINLLENIITNFDISYNFIYKKLEYIFDYDNDYEFLTYNNIKNIKNEIFFLNLDSEIEIDLLFEQEYIYYFDIEIEIINDCILFIMVIDNESKVDLNRKLYFVNKNKNNIKFIITPTKTNIYKLKMKQSSKNTELCKTIFKKMTVKKLLNIKEYLDDIKVINLERQIDKYYIVRNNFELNGILVNRENAIDGQNSNIQSIFNEYYNKKLTNEEIILGRKKIQSSGAIGYLLTMKNIFKQAILKNYEYIMICDDDIGICSDFIIKLSEVIFKIKHFRILMLGSSQWDWNDIKIEEDSYYIPNKYSNGSFCNIYHRITFEKILNLVDNLDSPFDDTPMKNNFIDGNCFVTYPNLVIAQLETSSIREIKTNRNYTKFRWEKDIYLFKKNIYKSYIRSEYIKTKKNKLLFLIGIVTFNRLTFLKRCVDSLLKSLSEDNDYILVFSNGNSNDGTSEYIDNLNFPKNISKIHIINELHYIYRQSNSILKYSERTNFDFGFIINDDLLFIKSDWDKMYYQNSKKYEHLVYFDRSCKKIDHNIKNMFLQSFCIASNCMGALLTFTKSIINKVGYFDEINFKLRGHSHIDYTIRCCRMNFNCESTLYDIKDSNDYIKLINENYVSTFDKMPLYLRELYKLDHNELERRNNIINDENRKFINCEFNLTKK